MFILTFFDLTKARDAKLLIAILPLFFLVLLAIKRIPLQVTSLLAVFCCVIFGKIAFFAAIAVISGVLLKVKFSFDAKRPEKI